MVFSVAEGEILSILSQSCHDFRAKCSVTIRYDPREAARGRSGKVGQRERVGLGVGLAKATERESIESIEGIKREIISNYARSPATCAVENGVRRTYFGLGGIVSCHLVPSSIETGLNLCRIRFTVRAG